MRGKAPTDVLLLVVRADDLKNGDLLLLRILVLA